jgi:uncharacterized protein (TIGR03089 family)
MQFAFTALPIGVLDYAVEVPGHPDHLVPYVPPPAEELALDHGTAIHTLSGIVDLARDRAEQLGAGPGARLLVTGGDLRSALIDALLVPLVVGGSAVLVRNEDTSVRPARVESERVTVEAVPAQTG